MGATKSIIMGVLKSIIHVSIVLIFPLVTFAYIRRLEIPDLGLTISIEESAYQVIVYWIIAFGLLASGCAFFKYTAPKQSVRKGLFGLIQIPVQQLYLWSYKFSGGTQITFFISNYGTILLDLTELIRVYLGIYFLLFCLRLYDFLDFMINKQKIQLERAYK